MSTRTCAPPAPSAALRGRSRPSGRAPAHAPRCALAHRRGDVDARPVASARPRRDRMGIGTKHALVRAARRQLVSVEHHAGWHDSVSAQLADDGITTSTIACARASPNASRRRNGSLQCSRRSTSARSTRSRRNRSTSRSWTACIGARARSQSSEAPLGRAAHRGQRELVSPVVEPRAELAGPRGFARSRRRGQQFQTRGSGWEHRWTENGVADTAIWVAP